MAHHTIQPVSIKPWQEWALAVVVAALAAGASWVGIHNGFTYDDVLIVEWNDSIHKLANWWRLFNSSYWPLQWGGDGYRPLTTLAFMLEWAAGGGKPWVFHAANILLYALSASLVYRLARTVLPVAAAFVAAALFAVHPVHVEAVAGVVGQSELLVAVFIIPAVTIYINGRNGEGLTLTREVGICLLFALGLLSKEHAIVLPLLLLAAELIVVNDKGTLATRFVRLRPFVLTLTAIALAFLWLHGRVSQVSTGFQTFIVFATNRVGPEGRIWTMFGLVPDWIRLFVWPAHLQTEYGPPEYPVVRAFEPYQLPGILILLAILTLIVIATRRKSTAVAFGLAGAIIALLPTSNFIVPTGLLLAERTLFLPSVGVMIAIGASVPWLYKHLPRPALRVATATAFVVLVGLGFRRTYTRTRVWESNDTLFASAIVDAPYVYRTHYMLGAWEFRKRHTIIGEKHYRRAIQLYDRDPYVFFGLGQEYVNFHMYRAAVPYLRRVLELDSTMVEGRARLALALTMLGRYDEAETEARRTLREGTRSGDAMRWCLEVIEKYRPTGRPPVVLPSDTADSTSGKLPPVLQKAASDTLRAAVTNTKVNK